jgi:hypothetical protein
METDPYQPPVARLEIAPDVEADRTMHLGHERQLQSVGSVHWLGAGLMVFLALLTLGIGTQFATGRLDVDVVAALAAELALGVLLAALGRGYRALVRWVRWPGTAVCGLGLVFAFPIGMILSLWILWLVWCPKGRRVFAPDYAEVRRRTPHLRYRPFPRRSHRNVRRGRRDAGTAGCVPVASARVALPVTHAGLHRAVRGAHATDSIAG